jgi:T4 superinfection immunity protein
MTFLLFCGLMYFFPAIVGRNKRDAAAIFVVNFLLGWTVIGWFVALIWACMADPAPVMVYAGVPGAFCARCGAARVSGANFCAGCGRRI